ncbi:MAG: DUF2231 domain-containing protein [Bacteroidales bacterium]
MDVILRWIVGCLIVLLPLGTLSAHETIKVTDNDTVQKTGIIFHSGDATIVSSKTFPTLHPLVVHFPIVLLILACILQLLRLVLSRKHWDELILYVLAGGIVTAYLAGEIFHPHTEGLSPQTAIILERHELFASIAMFSALVALLSKITGMYFYQVRQMILEIITAVILFVAATSVSVSGHWGAYLTHIEGVGPQGKYLNHSAE